jgi:hypothetical protein
MEKKKKKSPVLLSFNVVSNLGKSGVVVEHVNSKSTYFFEFDYDLPVKDFIARIKDKLIVKHYPRLVEDVYREKELTTEEIASRIQLGKTATEVNKYEVVKVGRRIYRLDRIIAYRNVALLVLEQSDVEGDEIGTITRYQYSGSLIFFLKKYREVKFKDIGEASSEWWLNSALIGPLNPAKREEGDE